MERVSGHHAIEEGIKRAGRGSTLYIQKRLGESVKRLELSALSTGKIAVKKISKDEMSKLSNGDDVRGALLFIQEDRNKEREKKNISLDEYILTLQDDSKSLVLALDGVTDPNNLGAILRSCDMFNVDLVLLPERRSCRVNETVLRISSGASTYVNVCTVVNLNSALEKLKKNGFWVYASDMQGESVYDEKFSSRSVIVMGSEDGMSQGVKKNADFVISIPTSGHIDSLNVSVATGIMLYEYRKNNH